MGAEKRTNVIVDKDLVRSGLRLTGLKTQRELIDFALRELVCCQCISPHSGSFRDGYNGAAERKN